MKKVTEIVAELAAPVAAEFGCELWDVEYVREAGQWYLRLYRAISCSFSERSLSDEAGTCTVSLPPNHPAMPFFFCTTVRVCVACLAASGRWFTSRLSALSCRWNTCMIWCRCVSLSANNCCRVSICDRPNM